MKIACMSEPHLGRARFRKSVNDTNFIEKEGYEQWFRSIDKIIEEAPDILIISGDMFDNPNPTTIAMTKCIEGLKILNEQSFAIYIVAGNHEFSNKNNENDIHPYQMLELLFPYIGFYYKGFDIIDLGDTVLAMLPHQKIKFNDNSEVDENHMNKIYAGIMKSIKRHDGKKILITHGTIESWAKNYSFDGEINESTKISNMIINDSFVENFDLVVIGHNHQHFSEIVKGNSGKNSHRVSPGSLLDERNSSDNGPTLLTLDASEEEKIDIKYLPIPSVNTHKLLAKNVEEMSSILRSISDNNIYLITYYGRWKDIPSELYEEALEKALYLNIVETTREEDENAHREMKDFWSWLKEFAPGLVDEFQEVLKKKVKEVI